jgi:hypothetical protein
VGFFPDVGLEKTEVDQILPSSVEIKHERRFMFYGCETWSLNLKEERRLSVFENRVLRRIFGPKRDEVTAEWRKIHNE